MLSLLLLIMAVALGISYAGYKAMCCAKLFKKIPSWSEIYAYSFDDDVRQKRSARAMKLFILLLIFVAGLAFFAEPGRGGKSVVAGDMAQIALILLVFANYSLRSVVYYSVSDVGKNFSIPFEEIMEVYKATGVYPRNQGSLGKWVVVTNLLILSLLPFVFWR